MACFAPLEGFWGGLTANGKRELVVRKSNLFGSGDVQVPCGQCIGCRLKYSAIWAARCWHEAQMHEDNCFLTLTFSDEYLPSNGCVSVRDCQLFLKRLRKYVLRVWGSRVRVAYCGEYGELNGRPHYHFLIFGYDFPDKVLISSAGGQSLFSSVTLSRLWPYGHASIGSVTFESSAYVARYMLKKLKGRPRYLCERTREFFNTSRRPGIGFDWFAKFPGDVFPSDEVIVDGRRISVPKYYDSKFGDQVLLESLKEARMDRALLRSLDNSRRRLKVRERVISARQQQVSRRYESA